MTPILPVLVAAAAAAAVGARTPRNGTGRLSPRSAATELTVPHAAITIFTPCERRNAASCRAYRRIVSRLREPYGTRPVSPK